jgi:hypothetical protein
MTGRERPMTETELDHLLAAWFEEGAPTAPDRIAENAMAEIATIPQERDWPGVLRSSFANAPLAWAAGILALAVGLGILLGPRFITDDPLPSPSPSGVPSGSPSAEPSQDPGATTHTSVTPVGTIDWVRVESEDRIFPVVEAEGRVIGYEIDADFNLVGWRVSEDGINWVEADPGTEAFWPAAIHAGEDTIAVISPDGCGTMADGPGRIIARLCSDAPGDAAVYRLEGSSWVELDIPAAHPPQAEGVVAGSRRFEFAAALDGDDWVVPSLHIVQVPWEEVYGRFEWENEFEPGVANESGPWPFWNEATEVTEIQQPGDRTIVASLRPALVGNQIEFTDLDTGDLVHSVAASLPGWGADELLRAYRGWGLDDISFMVSRGGEVSEVRPPWAANEDWYSSGVMGTALGRYFSASFVGGHGTPVTAAHLWTSDDGLAWRSAPLPPVPDPPDWLELAGSPNQLILTTHGPDAVWTSSDGEQWTEVSIDPALAGAPTPTDFGWIMNAFDAAAISADGISWEAIDLPLLDAEPTVSYLDGLFFYGPEAGVDGSWHTWVGTLRD